jgi:putative membrane protein
MIKKTDAEIPAKALFVRDHLAELRTDLANRRTLLSYIRTSLTFIAGGLALIKFAGHPVMIGIGWFLIPAGIIILVEWGFTYTRISRSVRLEKEKTEAAEQGSL